MQTDVFVKRWAALECGVEDIMESLSAPQDS